jgi:hypothetical protein
MRRLVLLFATVGVLAAATALVWRWWTAPPRDDAGALAAALATVPAGSDGAVALAQPPRAARWLASHSQALVLLKLAAPAAERSLPRIRGFLVALASESRGPLTVWWRGPELAAGAEVEPRAAHTLQRLAALEALPFRARATRRGTLAVACASAADLLGEGETGVRPAVEPGSLAALVRCHGRWWRARAERSTLELVTGVPTEIPEPTGPGIIVTSDLAALLSAVAPVRWMPNAPARLVLDTSGWAVELPAATVSRELRALLAFGGDEAADAPPGARRWRGALGELWALPGPPLAVASRPDLLAALPRGTVVGELGRVRGEDLARAVARVLEAADGIPGGASYVRSLRQAGPMLESVRLTRWRLLPQGGRIVLQW